MARKVDNLETAIRTIAAEYAAKLPAPFRIERDVTRDRLVVLFGYFANTAYVTGYLDDSNFFGLPIDNETVYLPQERWEPNVRAELEKLAARYNLITADPSAIMRRAESA